jgi:putative tryptophan/tyrosine transport system substrate-binding protein
VGISPLLPKKILIYAVSAIFFLLADITHSSAVDIVVVKSSSVKPYSDALEGFKTTCRCTVQELNLPEIGKENIQTRIALAKPDAVLAVGMDALTSVAKLDHLPVFYTMVTPNGPDFPIDKKNISGVSMEIPPRAYLHTIAELFPEVKKVGLIYNKQNTGKYAKDALAISSSVNLEIILREISHPGELPGVIEGLKGKIDLFWMIPDAAVITPQTIEAILKFSFKNKLPVIAFSDKYVRKGALVALSAESFGIGAQTGELVAKRLNSGSHGRPLHLHPKKNILSVNGKVAEKFGLTRKSNLLRKADEVL